MAGEIADEFARSTGENGVDGGRVTAQALRALPAEQWRVLHDVPWPGRPRASLDHVVLGPGGVFVIDTKTWTGTVAVCDGVLRQNRYSRQAVVTSAVEAASAVARLLRTASVPVSPVLCLVRNDAITANTEGVLVCSTANVADLLTSRGRVLADVQVQRLAADLVGNQRLERRVPASRPVHRRKRQTHGARYLVGAMVALAAAVTLVLSPDLVTGVVQDVAYFVADLVEDA